MIKVILWDIDGTLLNFEKAEEAAIKMCFETLKLGTCSKKMIRDYSKINKKYWEMLERGEMSKSEILVGRFREFFKKNGIDENMASEFNEEYQVRLGDTICFEPNATTILNSLKGTLRQCAVTNGTKIAQEKKLKNSGLDQLFDHIFISEDIGIEKPNKEFFDYVMQVIGFDERSEIMIVGDSLTSDILGGKNAGIITCLYHKSCYHRDSIIQPDYQIKDLMKVLDIVNYHKSDIQKIQK